ncbi:MAG: DUF3995 domain-containing protein [Pseudonocardiales bacterium]
MGDVILRRAAWFAFALGIGHALVSAYWGSGGSWLLDTLGGTLEDAARRGGVGVAVALWGVAAVKVIAAVLPLVATRPGIRHRRKLRLLTWIEACVLTGYGLALTCVGLLVQVGIVSTTDADHKALAWHAFLWDPWFLAWGVLCIVALRSSRRSNPVRRPALTRNPDVTVTAR